MNFLFFFNLQLFVRKYVIFTTSSNYVNQVHFLVNIFSSTKCQEILGSPYLALVCSKMYSICACYKYCVFAFKKFSYDTLFKFLSQKLFQRGRGLISFPRQQIPMAFQGHIREGTKKIRKLFQKA